ANGGHELRDACGQLVPARHVARVDALDIERAQPFVDDSGELRRQRRLLDIVFAEKQVERIGVAGLDPLTNRRGGSYRHAATAGLKSCATTRTVAAPAVRPAVVAQVFRPAQIRTPPGLR